MEKDRISEILRDYLTGSLSDEKKEQLEHWINSDPVNRQMFDLFREHWNTPESTTHVLNQEEVKHQIWDKLSGTSQPQIAAHWNGNWALKIAAVLMVIAVSLFAVSRLVEPSQLADQPVVSLVSKTNPPGRKSTINLTDGTQVTLNAGSEIKFYERFSDTARVVWLQGEAYFDVAHQSERPFFVFTEDIRIQVLGTSFNVRNFPELSDIQVSLSTGRLSVKSNDDRQMAPQLLDPGEQISFLKSTREFSEVEGFDPVEVEGWKDGIIYFRKASFEEIVVKLERWYGVEISTKNTPVSSVRFTGHFESENLDNVLTSIGFVFDFVHSIDNKQVIVQFN